MISGVRGSYEGYGGLPRKVLPSKVAYLAVIQKNAFQLQPPTEAEVAGAFERGEVLAVIAVAGELKGEAVEVKVPGSRRIAYYEFVCNYEAFENLKDFDFFDYLNGKPEKYSCLFLTKNYDLLYFLSPEGYNPALFEALPEADKGENSALVIKGKVRIKALRMFQTEGRAILEYVNFLTGSTADGYAPDWVVSDWID